MLYENLHMLFTKVVTIFLIIFIEIMRTNVNKSLPCTKFYLKIFLNFVYYIIYNLNLCTLLYIKKTKKKI